MTCCRARGIGIAATLIAWLSFPASAIADLTYDDPEGRFSLTFSGDWTALDANGDAGWLAYAGLPLAMTIVAIEPGAPAEGIPAGLRAAGLDPDALVETGRTIWNKWLIVNFDLGRDQGVTALAQGRDDMTLVIIGKGDRSLTNRPPQDVLDSIASLRFAGAEELPRTVPDFERYIGAAMASGPPGLSIVIADPKSVVYARGFGLADGMTARPARPDTVFQWGSITKTVTATAIMQLVERGQLDLDAPISRYLDYVPAQSPITARHLMTHSSGLPEEPDAILHLLRLDGQEQPDLAEVARSYFGDGAKPMFPPGTTSAYANPNYIILGELVAEISGVPFYDYVRQSILAPLGMGRTDFSYATATMRRDAAFGAIPADQMPAISGLIDKAKGAGTGAAYVREIDETYAWFNLFTVSEGGGGGLIGPANEMIRFGQMMLNGGSLDGSRILSEASVALLQQPQNLASGEPLGIGLAWHFGGAPPHAYIEHDGGGAGLQAKLRLYMEDGIAIAMMANGAGIDQKELIDAAANVVFSQASR